MSASITQKDLELRVTPGTVARFCCDDGSQTANAAIVLAILEEAQDIADGLLKKGWPDDDSRGRLFQADRAIKGAVCDIAISIMGRRKQEFLSADQAGMYATWRKEAVDYLDKVSTAERRARGENAPQGSGTNHHVAQHAAPSAPNNNLVFVRTRTNGYASRGNF